MTAKQIVRRFDAGDLPIRVQRALVECFRAFRQAKQVKQVWCFHHEQLAECLMGGKKGAYKRISDILWSKSSSERLARLRSFRPVRTPIPGDDMPYGYRVAGHNLYRQHRKEVPGTYWSRKLGNLRST